RSPPAEQTEPVIVGVMGVHDIDALRRHQAPQPPDIAQHPDRGELGLQGEARERLEPRLAGLVLEPAPRDQAEQYAMPAGLESSAELDHRVGASRPPAVGDELEDHEPPVAGHAAGLAPAARAPRTSP